jgi:hypothetical protein
MPGQFPETAKYGSLRTTHDDYDGDYLRRLKAFYKGGKAILRNPALLQSVMPQHRDETLKVYAQRLSRAFYIPYAGEIINFIVASMAAERLAVGLKKGEGAKEVPPTPAWYAELFEDISPPGGKKICMHDHVKAQITEALQCRVAWARIDLPPQPEQTRSSLADQDAAGDREAFVVPIPTECVIDWEEDDSGELELVAVYGCETKRRSVADARDTVTEIFTFYSRDEWARYEITHKRNEQIDSSKDVNRVGGGSLTMGRVPFVRLDVGDGLWAMDNIEGLCRESFNKRNGLSWAEFQSLFSELYEYGPQESPRASNPVIGESRGAAKEAATDETRGQGYVQTRAYGAKAEFVGPDTSAFAEARKSCDDIRNEMHRVTHQMALAIDNSSAALRRSAESKGHDKASAIVVFAALGQLARKYAEDLTNMVSKARAEVDLVDTWQASGMAKFDAISLDSEVERAVSVESIPIPSQSFQVAYKFGLVKNLLGDDATPELLETIRDELEENITPENMVPTDKRDKVDLEKPADDEEPIADKEPEENV